MANIVSEKLPYQRGKKVLHYRDIKIRVQVISEYMVNKKESSSKI